MRGFGLFGGSQQLYIEGSSNNYFGTGAGVVDEGGWNSFFGGNAGHSNLSGFGNSFFGYTAGKLNGEGAHNSFFGSFAGEANLSGWGNSFFGYAAGSSNSQSGNNSFFGSFTGYNTSTGGQNSFFGTYAGYSNTTGSENSFLGNDAGRSNTAETANTFVGFGANLRGVMPGASPVTNATAIGAHAYVAQANSLILGSVKGFNGAIAETLVGIGTPSPDRQLVVEGSQAVGKFRRYNATAADFAPAFLFERARGSNTAGEDILPGDYLGKVQFRGRVGGQMPEYGALVFIASDTNQDGRFSFVDRDLITERMVILNSGKVGIGTNAPTELLDVAGNLRVRGGIVYGAPAVRVPDYVFHPDYKLMSLPELGQYLKNEKHLPDIPNASEIAQEGINVGEFQMKLLQKVEELTLYALQQEQANARLREEAAAREKEAEQRAARQDERIKALEEVVKALAERDKGGR